VALVGAVPKTGWRAPSRERSGAAGLAHPDTHQPSVPAWQADTACPELDCVRDWLPFDVVRAAERRALATGVSADRVLITSRAISEDDYVAALAHSIGAPFEGLETVGRRACPVDDGDLVRASAVGMLPLRIDGELTLVVAPRNGAARRLSIVGNASDRIRLTTTARLQEFVARCAGNAVGRAAADALRLSRPRLSAGHGDRRSQVIWAIVGGLLAAAAFIAPATVHAAVGAVLAGVFLAWVVLRLSMIATEEMPPAPCPRWPASSLPVYTVIVALYREAPVVRRLIAALDALDYPHEKLDVKLVVEADDLETRSAIDALRLGPPYEVIVVPPQGPRTKPKALNAALPFARGQFTAVYDAEDKPEPDQLRRAIDLFHRCDERLACVQARLTIDNTDDAWLTRLFTAEYCGLFEVLLPGLAANRLPLPLGGSSNHFRTAVLHEVGAWDAYNVTEDADLGARLARFGYVTDVLASTTYEEAPAKLAAWLSQRTRWFKGWMQTWLVHMRTPWMMFRELKAKSFVAFQLTVGGTVLASLVHPVFLGSLLWSLAVEAKTVLHDDWLVPLLASLHVCAVLAGYFTSIALGFLGLQRRGLTSKAWILVLVPVLWLLLSVAAWRAVFQLMWNPYRWDKTEHGLARTSRSARPARRAQYQAAEAR
jgi:glycosyltransferase XagB